MSFYYHVSPVKGLTKLTPSIPSNGMTKHFGENSTIPRISVAPHIDDCLNAISNKILKKHKKWYVYTVFCDNAYRPSKALVPDVEMTNEYWILEEVACMFSYILKPNI